MSETAHLTTMSENASNSGASSPSSFFAESPTNSASPRKRRRESAEHTRAAAAVQQWKKALAELPSTNPPSPRVPAQAANDLLRQVLLQQTAEAAAAATMPSPPRPAPEVSDTSRTYDLSGRTFVAPKRYELTKVMGQGAYGLICAARDTTTGEAVAIKKVARAFDDAVHARDVLREIKLLRHFDHENVLALHDVLLPDDQRIDGWHDVYLVTELFESDLDKIIRSSQHLSDDHVQCFTYQILRGLKAVHSANVLHRDLKPGNVLVNKNCDLRIADFGMARGADFGDDVSKEYSKQHLTEYVATRWYRAPELLVQNENYGPAVDVWSVGCILAELLGRKPLFPGRDALQQLQVIVATLGAPTEDDLSMVASDQAAAYVRKVTAKSGGTAVPLDARFPAANPKAVALLQRMLVFDPRKRITAAEALESEYLAGFHAVNDEPTADRFDFGFERRRELDAEQLRREVWDQLRAFHPGLPAASEAEGEGESEAASEAAGEPVA